MYIYVLWKAKSSRYIRFQVVNCNFRIYFGSVQTAYRYTHIYIYIYNGEGDLWKSVVCILFVPRESFLISFLVCLFMTSGKIKYRRRWTRTTSSRNGRGDFNNSDKKLVIFMSCVFILNLWTFYFRIFLSFVDLPMYAFIVIYRVRTYI